MTTNTQNQTTNGNTVIPQLQTPNPPSLTKVLETLQRNIFKNLNAVKIGVIQSFNAANQTANVKVAFQQVTSISPTGVRTIKEYPSLVAVPVLFPSGGTFVLTFPIAAGDECLLLFNDREIDNWFATGSGAVPTTGRAHDLSDAIAIVGLRNSTRLLANVSTAATQLRTVDGTTFIEVNGTGIKVHGASAYEWDVQGYGTKVSWTGGANYVIDNYVTGASVTTNTHPINPPGPP